MKLRNFTAAALPVVVGVAVGAGTVHASPGASDVRYETTLVGNTVQTTLHGGFFEVSSDEQTVDVKSADGNTLVTLPLSVRQDGLEYPLPHAVRSEGQVLELTAVKNVAAARPAPVQPVASLAENQLAMQSFGSQFGIATAVGGFIGTALGALVGLLVGLTLPVLEPATILTGAAIGGIIGTLVAGGPTLIVAGIDLIGTLSAPPGTTKWMEVVGR